MYGPLSLETNEIGFPLEQRTYDFYYNRANCFLFSDSIDKFLRPHYTQTGIFKHHLGGNMELIKSSDYLQCA